MTIPSFRIRDIEVSPGLVLAPMSGVTCSAFRRLIKELNPGAVGLVVSEFVSVEGMTRGSRKTASMVKFREMERPYAVQIFGYDIARMSDAARMVQDWGVDILDINCGCPAPKVVKRGGGCELMRQPDHLQSILSAVRKAVSLPLTMKMRSGWDESSVNALEIGRMAEQEGVEAITIHGRTRHQLYRGAADWSYAQALAGELSIPVLGSGDVVDHGSALERLNYGVKGLYIGRGAMNNPVVFSEVLSGEKHTLRRDAGRCIDILERYMDLLTEDCSPNAAIGKIKQLASQMARGHPWRKSFLTAMTLDAQRALIAEVRGGKFAHSRDCGDGLPEGESTPVGV